jgi:hypothetical protein
MAARKIANGLNFEALRYAIERSDPDLVLGFYAEDAELSIVNDAFSQNSPFELCGKAEQEIVGEERVTFREACEYPDGSRVRVETTLEVRDGKIVRQEEVAAKVAQGDRQEEVSQRPFARRTHPGVDVLPPRKLS